MVLCENADGGAFFGRGTLRSPRFYILPDNLAMHWERYFPHQLNQCDGHGVSLGRGLDTRRVGGSVAECLTHCSSERVERNSPQNVLCSISTLALFALDEHLTAVQTRITSTWWTSKTQGSLCTALAKKMSDQLHAVWISTQPQLLFYCSRTTETPDAH